MNNSTVFSLFYFLSIRLRSSLNIRSLFISRGLPDNMLILWKENLAFLAVPKTGTTAIEIALAPYAGISFQRPPQVKHMTHQRFNRFIRPYLKKEGKEDMELFALMREPISWLGSWYRYRQREELRGTPNSTYGISFDDFVLAYLRDGERAPFARLGSQARQLARSRDEIGIDYLFRYEQMEHFIDFLHARLGVKLSLKKLNISPAQRLLISEPTEAALRRKYSFDFETYAAISM